MIGRVKIVLSDNAILRLSSQTQFTLVEAGDTGADFVTVTHLDFGKVWAVMLSAPGAGRFEIQLPVGVAAVRGSFMSAEYNSTTNGIVVACLEGRCRYENTKGAKDLVTGQQAVSVSGGAPYSQRISLNQLADWNAQNVPEVLTLTPTATASGTPTDTLTPTDTVAPTDTRTPIPSKTPRPSVTPRPSRTPTNTKTPRGTPSPTVSITPTPGPSPTPGAPAKLAFTLQPTTTPKDVAMTIEVAIEDADGTLVTEATNSVSLAIGTNGGGGALAGVTTVAAVNGVAHFQVSLNKSGAYTLVASATGLENATSDTFDISGSNALLFVISGLPATVSVGQSVTVTVTAIESGGATATDYVGTVKFQADDPDAILPADYKFTPTDKGSHAFTIVFRTTGTQTLKVFDTVTAALAGYAGTEVR